MIETNNVSVQDITLTELVLELNQLVAILNTEIEKEVDLLPSQDLEHKKRAQLFAMGVMFFEWVQQNPKQWQERLVDSARDAAAIVVRNLERDDFV